jgi:predicted signal transduction protein with EAL and GGDEF domain
LIPERSTRRPLSVSVGVATLEPQGDEEGVDSATLMRAADAAMYEAKRSGRNRAVIATPGQLAQGTKSRFGQRMRGSERTRAFTFPDRAK